MRSTQTAGSLSSLLGLIAASNMLYVPMGFDTPRGYDSPGVVEARMGST
jgi:hypothetical protein